jgi:ESCRT-II complex subunit VPS36
MLSMGIDSPVTKETTGQLYHSALARELSEFLRKPLKESRGGMMILPDVYCLYNRARGTALISPDDLYRACLLFERLDLPVRLRRFGSNVLAVHLSKKKSFHSFC